MQTLVAACVKVSKMFECACESSPNTLCSWFRQLTKLCSRGAYIDININTMQPYCY